MSTLQATNIKSASSGSNNIVLNADGTVTLASPLPIGSLPTGSWYLLNTLTASSSASLADTTSLTSSYTNYCIMLTNIIPATTGTTPQLQAYVSGVYQTTGYVGAGSGDSNGTAQGWTMTANVQLTRATDVSNSTTNGGMSGYIYINNPSSTSTAKVWNSFVGYYSSGGAYYSTAQVSCAYITTAAAVTGFQLLFSSGNIASGVIKVYGIK